jgi:hypothetical protein
MSTQSDSNAAKKPTGVIIGEWFIDENWLVAQHQ